MEIGGAYDVRVTDDRRGWRVSIVDASGTVVSERGCKDAAEARTYASTVRQHLYWLSPERFAAYHRLDG